MNIRFSSRASKYVWLCLPSVLSIGLTGLWLVSVAPSMQADSRANADWRAEQAEIQQRQKLLADAPQYTQYESIRFTDIRSGDSQIIEKTYAYFQDPQNRPYESGKVLLLLDSSHQCIGYYISAGTQYGELYMEANNPGLCSAGGPDAYQQQYRLQESSTTI